MQVDAGASATLSGITLTHAAFTAGQGIYNLGSLALSQCVVTGNTQGVYAAAGSTTTITQCTITRNIGGGTKGGGVYATGATVNLLDTSVTGPGASSESAYYGAGLYAASSNVTARNCTFSGLRSHISGGAIYADGKAGSVLTLYNCTIDSNAAQDGYGGGVYIESGAGHSIVNCTITGNSAGSGGGGITGSGGGGVTLHNTIVAGNSSTSGTGRDLNAGSPYNAASSNNLIGIMESASGITNGTNGNIGGTVAAPLDPQLAPLADNGGPTQTRLPAAGSPAIDAGSDARATAAGLTTDQRGFGRFAGTVDIGAVEVTFAWQIGGVLHVDFGNAATPVALSAAGGGDVTVTRGAATLRFAAASFSSIFASGAIIGDALDVNAPLAQPLGADASGSNLALNVNAGGSAVFAASQKLGALTLSGGGSAQLLPGSGALLNVASISITGGGSLDLGDNDLAVRGGSVGSWNGSAYTGVTGLVASGRNGGESLWSGSGIVSSSASGTYTTLAVADAAGALGITGAQTANFDGQTVDASTVLVKYTYGGDANLDGVINIDDYTQIDSSISAGGALKGWLNGDFNYDGNIDIDDYTIIDSNIAIQGPAL